MIEKAEKFVQEIRTFVHKTRTKKGKEMNKKAVSEMIAYVLLIVMP